MTPITVPDNLAPAFSGSEPTRVCDEAGNVLGYYRPRREATEEDYERAMKQFTKEEMEASLKSGPGRPLHEILADLRARYGE